MIWTALVPFLVILNPFALCLYLVGVMEDLSMKDFILVLLRACLISLAVFVAFALAGERLLVSWMGLRPEALRAFGGIIFLVVGYTYVVKGYRGTEMLRGSLEQLPSAIAMPFMIGAGTITQAILLGKQLPAGESAATLAMGLAVSFVVVVLFKWARDVMRKRNERIFERYVNILARANGLVIGTLSIEMIVAGLQGLWNGDSVA